MAGVENHRRRNATASTSSVGLVFYLIEALLQLGLTILVIVFLGLRRVRKRNQM